MLYLQNQTPFSATFLEDPSSSEAEPGVVCVLKARYVWCPLKLGWVLDENNPAVFQATDCWDPMSDRLASDLTPEKSCSELLLQGLMRSKGLIQIQQAGLWRTVTSVGTLSPEPILYWQSNWRPRKSKNPYLISPKACRFSEDWSVYEGLRFDRIFDGQNDDESRVFMPEKRSMKGYLEGGVIKSDVQPILFKSDTLIVNTNNSEIHQLWRIRIPWNLKKETEAHFFLVLQ